MQPHPCEALLEYQNQQGSCVAEQLIAEQLIAEDKPKTSMRRQEAHTPPTLQTTPCDTVKYSTEQVHKKNNIHHKPLAEQTLPNPANNPALHCCSCHAVQNLFYE